MSFIDARKLDPGSVIHADVCVVGAGPAGLALARELAGAGAHVAIIESGDMTFRHAAQFLNIGENTGLPNFAPVHSRFRQFGGSITRWAGQCRPLDPIDFEARDWIPASGWPFGLDHLHPYYRRAHELCGLGEYEYGPAACVPAVEKMLPLDSWQLETRMFRFSTPGWLIDSCARKFTGSPEVRVYLNATVAQIRLDPTTKDVICLEVRAPGVGHLSVVADKYVLACGGIENARLLLVSDKDVPGGVGNRYDLVGRYFTDHPYFLLGRFEPADQRYDRTAYVIEDYAKVGSEQRFHAALALSEEILRRERLNNCALYFVRRPRYKTRPVYYSQGGKAFQHLVEILRHDAVPGRQTGRAVLDALRGYQDITRTLLRQTSEYFRPAPCLALRVVLESTPCRESRVTLSGRRDRLGMRRVQVHWRLNEADRRGLEQFMDTIEEEVRRLQLGRLIVDRSMDSSGWPTSMTGGKHHMGTTRMHTDPKQGVVDPDCRVHGLSNLFIAGSSVFPTGGYANPTLTIVAMAIRLADHLKDS